MPEATCAPRGVAVKQRVIYNIINPLRESTLVMFIQHQEVHSIFKPPKCQRRNTYKEMSDKTSRHEGSIPIVISSLICAPPFGKEMRCSCGTLHSEGQYEHHNLGSAIKGCKIKHKSAVGKKRAKITAHQHQEYNYT
jgi:hypothetical protein